MSPLMAVMEDPRAQKILEAVESDYMAMVDEVLAENERLRELAELVSRHYAAVLEDTSPEGAEGAKQFLGRVQELLQQTANLQRQREVDIEPLKRELRQTSLRCMGLERQLEGVDKDRAEDAAAHEEKLERLRQENMRLVTLQRTAGAGADSRHTADANALEVENTRLREENQRLQSDLRACASRQISEEADMVEAEIARLRQENLELENRQRLQRAGGGGVSARTAQPPARVPGMQAYMSAESLHDAEFTIPEITEPPPEPSWTPSSFDGRVISATGVSEPSPHFTGLHSKHLREGYAPSAARHAPSVGLQQVDIMDDRNPMALHVESDFAKSDKDARTTPALSPVGSDYASRDVSLRPSPAGSDYARSECGCEDDEVIERGVLELSDGASQFQKAYLELTSTTLQVFDGPTSPEAIAEHTLIDLIKEACRSTQSSRALEIHFVGSERPLILRCVTERKAGQWMKSINTAFHALSGGEELGTAVVEQPAVVAQRPSAGRGASAFASAIAARRV